MKREPTNPKDKNAVAVYEEDSTEGHVLFTLSSLDFWQEMSTRPLLRLQEKKYIVERYSYRLEIPCVYRVYGPKKVKRTNRPNYITLLACGHGNK